MSAYVVVELTVKSAEAKDRYSAAAGPVLKQFGGEFIAGDAWHILTREPAFTNGAIIRSRIAIPPSPDTTRLNTRRRSTIAQPGSTAGSG